MASVEVHGTFVQVLVILRISEFFSRILKYIQNSLIFTEFLIIMLFLIHCFE
jgi:hypothetical protein